MGIDLTGLNCELPDLDNLIDEAAEVDSRPLREQLGMKCFALTSRQTAAGIKTFDQRRAKCAVDTIKALPGPREYLHMIVGQEFAGFDLIPAFLELAGAEAYSELYLSTLGFSRDNLNQLGAMIAAGQIPPRGLHILCSDFFRRGEPPTWDIGKLLAEEAGFEFRSFRNHTKLILAAIGPRRLVVESSANLRSCVNVEQFTMSENPELYEFHKAWLTQCLAAGRV